MWDCPSGERAAAAEVGEMRGDASRTLAAEVAAEVAVEVAEHRRIVAEREGVVGVRHPMQRG